MQNMVMTPSRHELPTVMIIFLPKKRQRQSYICETNYVEYEKGIVHGIDGSDCKQG